MCLTGTAMETSLSEARAPHAARGTIWMSEPAKNKVRLIKYSGIKNYFEM